MMGTGRNDVELDDGSLRAGVDTSVEKWGICAKA